MTTIDIRDTPFFCMCSVENHSMHKAVTADRIWTKTNQFKWNLA